MGMPYQKILCLDFDGVIHSYKSGWKGPRTIPDPPTEGAIQALLEYMDHFKVMIYSSRSNYWFGRRAMQRWLLVHLMQAGLNDYEARKVIDEIGWPRHKPPAYVTLDDRALQFKGEWPTVGRLNRFQPWYRQVNDEHEFKGDGDDCVVCGEGRMHYLHQEPPTQAELDHKVRTIKRS